MERINGRLKVLERRLRRMQVALLSAFILLIFVITAGFSWARTGETSKQGSVLRVHGLIIEDDEGRPRILIGAPTPKIAARKHPEGVDGIDLLGANGADRIVISYPGLEPQVMGKVEKRSIAVPSAGLVINDSEGNERAGFGVSDDGTRISLGLDYADRDATGLLVSPGFPDWPSLLETGNATIKSR
jgi:hypothetical protein